MLDDNTKNLVLERDKTIWIASVKYPDKEPEEVWQRIDLEQDSEGYSSWKEFRKSFYEQGGIIMGLKVKFRSHIEELPADASGYYFRKGIISTMPGNDQANCYVTGYIIDGILHKIWYRVPEIMIWDTETVQDWTREDEGIVLNG